MKKYIIPETKIFKSIPFSFVCASMVRSAKWGGDDEDNEYVNKSWYNQGYGKGTLDERIEDSWGDIDAQ